MNPNRSRSFVHISEDKVESLVKEQDSHDDMKEIKSFFANN